eukprot:1700821-Lingulodinium_polyedra.AAC.1
MHKAGSTPGPRNAGSMLPTGGPARTVPARFVGSARPDPSTCLLGAPPWKELVALSRLRMALF